MHLLRLWVAALGASPSECSANLVSLSPFFTPLLPQSGFQDHVLQDLGESYLNKQGKFFSCLAKYRFVDSESSENPMETSDQGNYIGQVQVLQNTGWASKAARGKWQQSWGQWQGKCEVVMGNSGHQEAEDWHLKVLRQSSLGGIVLKAAFKIKTKWEDKWPPGPQEKKYGMELFRALRRLLQGNLGFREE